VDEQHAEHEEGGRADRRARPFDGRPRSACRPLLAGRAAQPAPAERERDRREESELQQPERRVEEREVRGEDPGRGDPDEVGQAEAADEERARRGNLQQRQEAGAERQVEELQDEEPGQAAAHRRTLAIA
jgi:hypothetical protein